MTRERTYLDFNATAPLRPAARARMIEVLDQAGNPSSVHADGRRARASVEAARTVLAGLLGTRPEHVTFTSGATEAAALALTPDLCGAGGEPSGTLLVGGTEHPAVTLGHRFPSETVRTVAVRPNGILDLEQLADTLQSSEGRPLLALQLANSETGVLQPIAAAADLVHRAGGLLVCDAAQGLGRVDCRFETLGADLLLVSGHKLGGPQGVGALARRDAASQIRTPLVRGGGQERGLRGGTENVAAIAGFGAALHEVAAGQDGERLAELRDGLEARLKVSVPDVVIFGAEAARLPNTTAFAIPGLSSETLLIGFDLEGLSVSSGSACSSGKVSRSAVLEAMGVNDHLAKGLIRLSFGWSSTRDDVDRFMCALDSVLRRVNSRVTRPAA